jgi:hypothetical protein
MICPVSFQNLAESCEPIGLNIFLIGEELRNGQISFTFTSSLIISPYF